MKQLLPTIVMLSLAASALARPVDPAVARRAAQAVLGREVVDATPKQLSESYLFLSADGHGFVLLAADDCVRPLLAYSADGQFCSDPMPPHLEAWLEGYQREIASAKALGIVQTTEVAREWELLLQGAPKRLIEGERVGPLLASAWSQEAPYNADCPYDSAAIRHTLVGCTATATAQVMRYWGHPAKGRGSHSYLAGRYGVQSVDFDSSVYDWDHMLNKLTVVSPEVSRRAVAKLCYDVGVAMDMSYSTSGSGAYAHSGGMLTRHSAELALENHFSYNPGMYNACKDGYTDAEWADLISDELNAGRPVIYTGSSLSSGHAFVVDGYDTTGLFHVNWGWGGHSDGYYTLSRLAVGSPGQPDYSAFNQANEALIGVYPVEPGEGTSEVAVVSADPAMGSVSGSGTYPADADRAILLATAADGYRFSHWSSGNRFNPIFYYPTADYADTACFVPLSTDTVGYCMDFVPNFDTLYSRGHCEWGIRIPAGRIPAGRQLVQVRNFIYTMGDYVLRIYQGERPETPLYEDVLPMMTYGWRTVQLGSPVAVDPSQPLWITFATEGIIYAMGITPYAGVDDGSWVLRDGEWQLVDTAVTGYYTWSIQGILSESSGIAEVRSDGLDCTVDGLTLRVTNPQGLPVAVYDLMGRRLAAPSRSGRLSVVLPSAGVYLLKADGFPARRVVATHN